MDFSLNGGGTSLSSHRAGFGVFRSKALSNSTAQSAFAGLVKCDGKCPKAAFTLAEVLITLAIIGIVAALTIPTLVQNYQERACNTASQVFQRKLGEALRVMNVQGTLAGYITTEAFVNELSKHIKITRICDNDLAVSMEFISSPGNAFWLWSSEEYSKNDAYNRYFFSMSTYRSSYYRYSSNTQAVCLAE